MRGMASRSLAGSQRTPSSVERTRLHSALHFCIAKRPQRVDAHDARAPLRICVQAARRRERVALVAARRIQPLVWALDDDARVADAERSEADQRRGHWLHLCGALQRSQATALTVPSDAGGRVLGACCAPLTIDIAIKRSGHTERLHATAHAKRRPPHLRGPAWAQNHNGVRVQRGRHVEIIDAVRQP